MLKSKCFHYTNGLKKNTEEETEKKEDLPDNYRRAKFKTFDEFKEAYYKKKGKQKIWLGVRKKNDIDLL